MSLNRADLEKKLEGVENKDDIITFVMTEHGKMVNDLKFKVEELKSQILDEKKNTDDANAKLEGFKDYEDLKAKNEELSNQINAYLEKEKNQKYYETLKKVGFNEEFIDEEIFRKVPKTEKMEDFEKQASEFLKEKPMYAAEDYRDHSNIFEPNGTEGGQNQMSDEEMLKALKEMDKK